ncbi:MAG: peptide deformylase [Clostridia bacterium]|nr:peptide deformylase [Clostridia bacterium]
MAIRVVRLDNDEILRKKSREIEVIDNKIRQLSLDMLDTMYKYDGVGLAAPQIGILKRIITYDIGQGPRVLINPVITKKQGKQTCEEGCLSSPNVFGMVDRPKQIIVEAVDLEGNKIRIKAEDLEAVVLSHEIDHLDGKLFLDIAYDMYTVTEEELAQAKAESEQQYNKEQKKNKKSKKK